MYSQLLYKKQIEITNITIKPKVIKETILYFSDGKPKICYDFSLLNNILQNYTFHFLCLLSLSLYYLFFVSYPSPQLPLYSNSSAFHCLQMSFYHSPIHLVIYFSVFLFFSFLTYMYLTDSIFSLFKTCPNHFNLFSCIL